jgi:hypothetical protein
MGLVEQNESGWQQILPAKGAAACGDCAKTKNRSPALQAQSRRYQSSSDFLDFFGFREFSGLMLIGLPTLTAVASASGDLKNSRQPGLSCDLFWIMQTVIRSTSGTNAPQSRIASPLQACSCSGV